MENVITQPIAQKQIKTGKYLWRNSIRWPLLITISGNVLLTLVVIGFTMYAFIATNEQRSWEARQSENADLAGNLLQNFVQDKQNQLRLISLPDQNQFKPTSQALQNFIINDSSWLEIVRLNNQGETMVSGTTDQSMLQNMFTTRQAQWFLQAKSGQNYLGSVGISANDVPYLVLSVPTPDGGVVAGRLRMDVLGQVVSKIRFGETGIAYIINQEDGRILAFPNPSVVLANSYATDMPIYQAIQHTAGSEWKGSYHSLQGEAVQTYARLIPNTSWVLITEVSMSEVTKTRVLALRITIAGMIFLWIIITLSINAFLQRWVLRPVGTLSEGADRIGKGDLQYRIPVERQDELGRVTEHFNQMTNDLAEREQMLVLARDQALIDSQFKSDLLARVSHDLRQPLGVILGFAEMLRDEIFGPISEPQRRAVGEIIAGNAHLSQMVSDLLDAARLESHRIQLRNGEFSPELLLRQVQGQLALLAERKKIALTTELDPNVPQTLIGDANRLTQILNNLTGNAIKFTQQGGVHIRLSCADSDHWSLSVSDTGCGIPADALVYIFEPFRQVNDQATRDKGGVGLGLSIVQQLVQLMNGQIRVESTVGAGSTFTVTLPIDGTSGSGE